MQWTDVTTPPKTGTLRLFAGLLVAGAIGATAWRASHSGLETRTIVVAAAAAIAGVSGLVHPRAVRWIYTGWMAAAFPIGWTLSYLMLAALYFLVFTPVAIVFRLAGRDALRLSPPRGAPSYWTSKPQAADAKDYLRQF